MDARVQKVVAVGFSQQQGTRVQPDVVISPASQQCSNCASTMAPGDEPQENVPAVDTQRYPVEDITMQTPCELHVKAKNITALAAYRSALPVIPGGTIHGRQVSPGYSVLTVEQIVEAGRQNEKLELDFVGTHGCIQWRKAYIKLIGNTTALVNPPSLLGPYNDDDGNFAGPSSLPPRAPSPSSPPRARSTPTPLAPTKGKNRPHPAHRLEPQEAEHCRKENRP
ncbi:hypothetical protein PAHAL_6G163500 [Panicum hallii]|uniref:DUF8039 domain-containing protein n=1 Tax=Panicum hallii TaxID=206008 RepID=A0A2T8IGF1_9POAL|nr:hypothetical protein PAHAL_6G163500 [Panicum hallii]